MSGTSVVNKPGVGTILLTESMPSNVKFKRGGGRCKLLEKLFSIVGTQDEPDSILTGYFFKTFDGIMNVCESELLSYLFKFDEHIENIVYHCYNRSISAILRKILVFEKEPGATLENDKFEVDRRRIIEKILNNMSPSKNPEGVTNVSWVLCKVVNEKQHLNYILSKNVINKLFSYINPINPPHLKGILMLVMELYKVKVELSISQIFNDIPDQRYVLEYSNAFLDEAKKYLENPEKTPRETDTTKGFGPARLKIIEWLQSLIALKDEAIGNKLVKLSMGKLLLSLVRDYCMNSILHLMIFNVFEEAIKSNILCYLNAVFCV